MIKRIPSKTVTWFLFILFLSMGIAARIWQFGDVPADINQDEAYSGYEALSLLQTGMDSHGYTFPVYLVVWGSGMSALNSYLMMPFLALFGAKTWVIRLPQVIVACLTLLVVYFLMKRIINERAALCALFLLAISPWHIMMSRWGLDCNLAPGFLIFGLYFFLRGLENSHFFLLSALFYGLSLYCYATIWPFVPIMLLLQFGYCLFTKKIRFSRSLLLSVVLLGVLALPLILFLFVNFGLMEEIRLPFLSIPKMLSWRGDEISIHNIYDNMKNLWNIVKSQHDDCPWNATERFGIFYFCTLPFFFIGVIFYIVEIIGKLRKREFSGHMLIIIQLFGGVLLGLSIHVNINRVNILFIPMILIASSGIYYLCRIFSEYLLVLPLIVYLALFGRFEYYYFTEYAEIISNYFDAGIEDAVQEAMVYDGTICVPENVLHPKIMFYSGISVTEYLDTVVYRDDVPWAYYAVSFGRFTYIYDKTDPDESAVFILKQEDDLTPWQEKGFILETYQNYIVAHKDAQKR